MSGALSSMSFRRLVSALKKSKKNCSVVEQCCGGILQSSIMAQAGASSVFIGGTVAYNTKKGKKLLLDDSELHAGLTANIHNQDAAQGYIDSKLDWTARVSIAYCKALGTDYAIVEGGAAGPTFRPGDMNTGFAVVAIAGKDELGNIEVLQQEVIRSTHADREGNMRLFADAAADMATGIVNSQHGLTEEDELPIEPQTMLDRCTHLRTDTAALASFEQNGAKYVVVRGNQILTKSTDATKPVFLTRDELDGLGDKKMQKTFLGRLTDKARTPCFGIDLLHGEDTSPIEGLSFVDTRTSAPLFRPLDNELALYATAMSQWQRRSAFCNLCGAPTTLVAGGTCRQCSSCNTMSWPRQDPSMIAAISSRDGQKILLAHSKRHPPRLHTTLAGFVEAGETMEKAVARETFEETGIIIDPESVKYVASQPWPFPQSCMLAFTATADHSQPLNIDEQELETADWFDKDTVRLAAAVEGAVMQHDVANSVDSSIHLIIPPKGVVARKLIDTWLDGNI